MQLSVSAFHCAQNDSLVTNELWISDKATVFKWKKICK